jgi:RNA polymerase sigma-70 factor (ECF subfamily)
LESTHIDGSIAKRLLRGDEAAFRELFDDFFPKLYRYALVRVGDEDEAKDVVQATFCKAFERLETYRGEASLYGWMCRICRNTLIDRSRRARKELRYMPPLDCETTIQAIIEAIEGPRSDEPEYEAARSNLKRLIQTTLDLLPDHYGDVLEWKYVEGLSVREIAEHLSIGPKAAESLLTRARNAFREAVATMGESADLLPQEDASRG